MLPDNATPAEGVVAAAAWHYLMNPAGSDGLDGLTRHDEQGQAVIDYRAGLDEAFDEAGAKAEARLDRANLPVFLDVKTGEYRKNNAVFGTSVVVSF